MNSVRSDLVVDPMDRKSMLASMKLKQESAQRDKVAKEDAYWDKHKAGRADRLKRGRERTAKMTPKPVKTTPKEVDTDSETSGDFKNALVKGATDRLSSGGGSGGAMNTTGDVLMMSGNPYAMAAGGAMKVIGAVQAKKEAAAQKVADDENNRRRNVQQAMAQLGSGIGTIGMA